MGTQKQKRTRSARGQRRSHHALKPVNLIKCPKCGKPVLSHQLCSYCGTYNNRKVIDVTAKMTKKEQKTAEREKRLREKEQKVKAKEKSEKKEKEAK